MHAIPPTITVIKTNFLIPPLFPWTTPRMRQINKNIICNKAPAILEIFFPIAAAKHRIKIKTKNKTTAKQIPAPAGHYHS